MIRILAPCVAATLAVLAFAPSVRAASFLPLSRIQTDGDHDILLVRVSGDAQTFVGSRFGNRSPYPGTAEGIRWDPIRGARSLGPAPDGVLLVSAEFSSSDGSRVAGYFISDQGQAYQPFIWDVDSGFQAVGDGPGASMDPNLSAMTGDGSTLVGWRTVPLELPEPGSTPLGVEAFAWTEASGIRSLGWLDADEPWSYATGISADGSTVVGISALGDRVRAFVWDATHGMQDLGGPDPGLPTGSQDSTSAEAISADGSTIVGFSELYGGGFIFRRDRGATDPGTFLRPSGLLSVRPQLVSADGSVVIGEGVFGANRGPFIWDAEHGLRTVDSVLESLDIGFAGWTVTGVRSISDDGQTIVGSAWNPLGGPEDFIAVIPEPGTAMLIGIGLALVSLRARSYKRSTTNRSSSPHSPMQVWRS